jgi:cell division protein FtsQ
VRKGQSGKQERSTAPRTSVSAAGRRVAQQKKDDRDRRRREISQRRFLYGVLVVGAVIALVWGAVAFWQAPIFTIDSVEVSGVHHLAKSEVLSLAAVSPDETLLRVSPRRVESRVKTSPWIAEATVTRRFPHTLDVTVTERQPFALVDAQGAGQWLVTADGYWIVAKTKESTAGIVPIKDVSGLRPTSGTTANSRVLLNALAVLSGISPQLRAKTKSVSASTVEKTMLVLKNDVQIAIGDSEDIQKKDLIARGILSREKRVVYVNVRITDRPTWRGLESDN